VLDARQRGRLQQIVFQAEGLSALSRPEVIRALQLDDDQLEQIQGALSDHVGESKQLRDAIKAAAPDFEPADPDQEAARKEQEKARMRSGSKELNACVESQVRAILSRRQREIFARMQGEAFDFSKLRAQPQVR
jgi:hypothetical protein